MTPAYTFADNVSSGPAVPFIPVVFPKCELFDVYFALFLCDFWIQRGIISVIKLFTGGMYMKNKVRFLTRTALLLAVAIAFQIFGKFIPYNNFIVGPVVNAVLLVATAAAGLWSGVAISVIAPLVSAFTNKAPIAPLVLGFSPFIIIGNVIIVLLFHLLRRKKSVAFIPGPVLGVAAGAVLKFAFLYASISVFTSLVEMKPQQAVTLTNLFSWPQLITAIVGGAIALVILKLAGKSLEYGE